MSVVYPTFKKLYAYLNGTRTDITADLVGDITGKDWGIQGHRVTDRVASTGSITFYLKDPTRKYIPDSSSPLNGWGKGVAIELEIAYETRRRFRFYVKKITPSGKVESNLTHVTAVDWMDKAAEFPVVNPGILTNQRADDVLRTSLGLGITAPQDLSLQVGEETFPSTFDVASDKTKVYDEAVRAALSELGWVYLRKDRVYGETLVLENASSRVGTRTLSQLPKLAADSGFLLKQDGGYILKQDGGRIILNQTQDAFFNNSMMDFEAPYGENITNHLTVYANPRKVDTQVQVFFQLRNAIPISPGATYELKGNYTDPVSGGQINCQNMVTPVPTTDYLFNSSPLGTGTDLTSTLAFAEPITFGSEGYTARLRNGGTAFGWLIKFDVRGYRILDFNPIPLLIQNSVSQNAYGVQSETLDQKYKADTHAGKAFAGAYVEEERNPRTQLRKIRIKANRSPYLMEAFLGVEMGYLVRVKVDELNLDGYFFILGTSDVTITPEGSITCTYVVKELVSFLKGLTPIAVDFGGEASGDALDFGYLPQVSHDDVTKISLSVWLYLRSTNLGFQTIMFASLSGLGGWDLYMEGSSGNRVVVFNNSKFTTFGRWKSPINAFNLNAWTHIVVTCELNASSADTEMYINGVKQTVTESNSPAGSLRSSIGAPLIIGSYQSGSSTYHHGIDGIMKDPRVYKNYLLTQEEVTALYNSGVMAPTVVTTGLAFQGFAVRTKELSSYINQTLTNNLKVRDNVRGMVAAVNGAPVGRSV